MQTMNDSRRQKRIAIVDEGPKAPVARAVLRLIENNYDIITTQDYNADYVIHSCAGYDVLKYSGIRIFVSGECVSPDFNISDYALSFERMTYSDRYYWLPLIRLYPTAYEALKRRRIPFQEILEQRRDFCCYVMSNTKNSAADRTEIFEKLCTYKKVNSGGRWRNNVGGPVKNKIEFEAKHKFAIAFENHSRPGYLTEKFAQAAQAGCIPIYWGDPGIGKIFNPKSFINCHDYSNFDEVLDQIKRIDTDDSLYVQMLKEPWFKDHKEPKSFQLDQIISFISNIFDQPTEAAYRRNRSRWGLKHEMRLHRMYNQPHLQFLHLARKFKKRLLGKH